MPSHSVFEFGPAPEGEVDTPFLTWADQADHTDLERRIAGGGDDWQDSLEGLLDDDEEGSQVGIDNEAPPPVELGVPFAPAAPPGSHYPVKSSHPRAFEINYVALDGREVGGNPARRFGATRGGGSRRHAGVDIYARAGNEVVACQDGTIVSFYGFCCGREKTSWALIIDHDTVVINYGEVTPDSLQRVGLAPGSSVRAGQTVAFIGVNPGGSSMLHFETYAPGTTRNKQWPSGRPAPTGLLDPTRYLLAFSHIWPEPRTEGVSIERPRVFKLGSRGHDVAALQVALNDASFSTAVDGTFGRRTEAAVRAFQASRGLVVDGVVGPQTQAALRTSSDELGMSQVGGREPQSVAFDERDPAEWLQEDDEYSDAGLTSGYLISSDGIGNELEHTERGHQPNRTTRAYGMWLQHSLNQVLGTELALDGVIGPRTRSALRAFQQRAGINVDGVPGPQTERALLSAGAHEPPVVGTQVPGRRLVDLDSFTREYIREMVDAKRAIDCADLAIEVWTMFGERVGIPISFRIWHSDERRYRTHRRADFPSVDRFARFVQGNLGAVGLIRETVPVVGGHRNAVAGDVYLWEYFHARTGRRHRWGHTQIIDRVDEVAGAPHADRVTFFEGSLPAIVPRQREERASYFEQPRLASLTVNNHQEEHEGRLVGIGPRRFGILNGME